MRLLPALFMLGACDGNVIKETQPPSTDDTSGPVDTAWPLPNGDDVALLHPSNGTLGAYWNDQHSFSGSSTVLWTLEKATWPVLLCDYDADGLDDLWLIESADNKFNLHIYLNEGGSFATTEAFNEQGPKDPAGFKFFCGDFEADGAPDLFMFKDSNGALFTYMNHEGTFGWADYTKTTRSVGEGAVWIPGDWLGLGYDQVALWLSNALVVYGVADASIDTSTALATVSIDGADSLAAVDYNTDGYDDLGIWNGSTLVLWPNVGGTLDQASKEVFVVSGSGTLLGGDLR